MSVSVEDLRTFVIERLTVAAEEILRVFQQKIERYEDEVNYQRRLVESVWRPEIMLHRIEFSQPPVCHKEEVPAYQQQDRSYSLENEDSKPPPIKEEPQELWCHRDRSFSLVQKDSGPLPIKKEQDKKQLMVKQERVILLATPNHEENDQSEDQILDLNSAQSEKSQIDTTVGSSVSPEPDCDQQLLSNSPHITGSKDQKNYNNKNLESTADEDLKPTVKQNKRKRHRGNANNPADSAVDCDTHTGATSATFTTGVKLEQFESDLTGHWRIQTSDNQAAAAIGLGGSGWEVTSSVKSESNEHIKVHTAEKPYLCKICEKSFNRSSGFIKHLRVHTCGKPYLCKTCGETFGSNPALISHMRVHTTERPYLCKTCGKAFKQCSALIRHITSHK